MSLGLSVSPVLSLGPSVSMLPFQFCLYPTNKFSQLCLPYFIGNSINYLEINQKYRVLEIPANTDLTNLRYPV